MNTFLKANLGRVAQLVIVFTAATFSLSGQILGTPAATLLTPSSAAVGTRGLTLIVSGSQFVVGSTVFWGNQPLATILLNSNQLSATVPASSLALPGQVPVIVLNPNGIRSNALVFTVGSAITIVNDTLPPAQAGVPYSQTLTATGGTAPYAWAVVDSLPPGLTLSSSGQLTGTPNAQGTYTFNVRATDAAQSTGTKAFTLTVGAPVLTISTTTLPTATEGVVYSQVLQTANGSAPFRWTAGAGVPQGLALDPATGTLSGTPATRGTYTFSVQVTDRTNASASRTLSLVVQAAALSITTVSPLLEGTVGTPYSQPFSAIGGNTPYTWTMQPQIPGLTLDRATGVLAGTPDQAGSNTVSVQVVDASGTSVSKQFTINIQAPQIRITNTSPLPPATSGTAYQQRFLVTGGRAPYSWSMTPAVPGMVLDPGSGVWSGTPTTAGTFSFTVQVTDSATNSTSRAFTIAIAPGQLQLAPAPDTLRTMAGTSFSMTPSASGGTLPYSWSANGLPEGVTIDPQSGNISGTPMSVGSFLFAVRVTDANRVTATDLYRLEVTAPELPALTTPGLPDVDTSATQRNIMLQLSAPYALPLTGELILGFAPDAGTGDPSIQFSTGGRRATFRIPAGSTEAQFDTAPLGLQTGTVSGSIALTATLQSQGATLTPTPLPVHTMRIDRAAPVIRSASFTRGAGKITLQIAGYSNSRELTQAVFRFSPAAGSSLTTTQVTVPVEDLFGRWFSDTQSSQYGGQFSFTQEFSIQGDANAVTPASVTLTNRSGSTSADIR